MRYKILPHTADLRLKIFGKTEEELFSNALLGLAAVIKKDAEKLAKRKPAGGYEKIVIEGHNREELLISFLNEVLVQANINKKIYIWVKFLKLSPYILEAHIFGTSVDHFDEDVKAVTYHDVKITQNKRGIFEVTITLDI
jgi:SHS2 domain-containing protein